MSTLHIVQPKQQIAQCVICNKPLGADSKDSGFITCHEHRTCKTCSGQISAREIRYCFDKLVEELDSNESITDLIASIQAGQKTLELQHTRCEASTRPTLEQDPTLSLKQTEYDFLNLIRLMVIPNMDLSVTTNENNAMIQNTRLLATMDIEQKMIHLKMMEACVAQAAIAIRTDPKFRKDALAAREKEHAKRAKQESETSSRPVGKPADEIGEVELSQFMQNFGITSRKVGVKLQRLRDNAAKALYAVLKDSAKAKAMADMNLRQQIEKNQKMLTEE